MHNPTPSVPGGAAPGAGAAPVPAGDAPTSAARKRSAPGAERPRPAELTSDDAARGFERVRSQTTLPEVRARQVWHEALREARATDAPTLMGPIERAVMIASQRLWAEERRAGG